MASPPPPLPAELRRRRGSLRKKPTCRVVSRASVLGWWVHTYFEGHVAYDQWITAVWFVRRKNAEQYALRADFTMGVRRPTVGATHGSSSEVV